MAGGGAVPSPPTNSSSTTSWMILLFTGGIWGITFSLAKLVTEAGAHPLGISWWQAVIGASMAFAYCIVRKTLPAFSRQHIIFYIVCGIFGTAIPGTVFFYAAPHIPAGVISITIATVPMLTLRPGDASGPGALRCNSHRRHYSGDHCGRAHCRARHQPSRGWNDFLGVDVRCWLGLLCS